MLLELEDFIRLSLGGTFEHIWSGVLPPQQLQLCRGIASARLAYPSQVQHCWAEVPIFREHSVVLFCMKQFLATALTVGV